MGIEPHDYDLATNATPDQVIEVLRKDGCWNIIEVGKSFGVLRVRRMNTNEEYEIATFRTDVGGNGRHPDSVNFTTIEEDVKRRDFTINALFYDIQNKEIVDLVGGLADIKLGNIRTVGNPEDRFREDRLRVMRAIRFASKFCYFIDDATRVAIESDNNLNGVSPERIHDEFVKSVTGAKDADHLFGILHDFDMWPRIFPTLKVKEISHCERSVPVMLALILGDNEASVVAKKLNELKYSDIELRQTTFLMNYRNLNPMTAAKLRKLCVSCHLEHQDLVTFSAHHPDGKQRGLELMHIFEAYMASPPVKGDVQSLSGYSGKALGEEIQRREAIIFEDLAR
jgi:tRNA nucleotidyltransferase/poly(A) polymerase